MTQQLQVDTSISHKQSCEITSPIVDTRIRSLRPLLSPAILLEELATPLATQRSVYSARNAASQIIQHSNDRLLCVIGPCSIHDPKAALEYAQRLAKLAHAKRDTLLIVMRVYFEKPRTTIGWKGLINDPLLDGSFAINQGLRLARKLLLDINALDLPCAGEILDTISPQFICDLISWGAIGARTTECQLHRELSSGLSFPIGFKNSTQGDLKVATDAIIASASPHCFLGVSSQGLAAIVQTAGNQDCHIVLRGSNAGPNYSAKHIAEAEAAMQKAKVLSSIMIDCSHGNSEKKHANQTKVVASMCEQVAQGNNSIIGCMIESNLVEGNQSLELGRSDKLTHGKSITDACVSWEETERMIQQLEEAVIARRKIDAKQ